MEGYTPETIPMKRLAEYMIEVSKLFGQEGKLRFVRVEDNCVALDAKVQRSCAGRVRSRLRLVSNGTAPSDAMAAEARLNAMLAEDNSNARVKTDGAIILRFPGKAEPARATQSLKGPASVTGYLYHLAEDREGVVKARLRIHVDGGKVRRVDATCANAFSQDLKSYLFTEVRVSGTAEWERGDDGIWTPHNLHVLSARQVDKQRLKDAVNALRRIDAGWVDNPISFQNSLRDDEGDDQ